ncbi:glycoside hydrolase family 127 protein, partial [Erysipelatoclostridium ramosum]
IGWDTPDSKLRGHTSGHYLSALAYCYAATKNEEIRRKADYMLQSLKECQDAFADVEGCHEGFLSAYTEEQFDLLE